MSGRVVSNPIPLPLVAIAMALLLLSHLSSQASAHGGQIEVGESAKGPVSLTADQVKAIGLTLGVADLRPLADLLILNGEIKLLADRQALVSTRISGQVSELFVQLGDRVKPGQRLARIQSRLLGEPPPSVTIVAPRAGIVDAVNISLGQSIEPASVLFEISDRYQVNMVGRVYEEDLGKVKLGQDVRVRALSFPDKVFVGKVGLIGPTLDAITRTAVVWVRLENHEGFLRPNLFAKAAVVLKQELTVLAVPNSAMMEANGEKFVFVKQGDEFDRVDIKVGIADDEYSEVLDGLVPGDEVVTQGNRELYTLWLTGSTKPRASANDASESNSPKVSQK